MPSKTKNKSKRKTVSALHASGLLADVLTMQNKNPPEPSNKTLKVAASTPETYNTKQALFWGTSETSLYLQGLLYDAVRDTDHPEKGRFGAHFLLFPLLSVSKHFRRNVCVQAARQMQEGLTESSLRRIQRILPLQSLLHQQGTRLALSSLFTYTLSSRGESTLLSDCAVLKLTCTDPFRVDYKIRSPRRAS